MWLAYGINPRKIGLILGLIALYLALQSFVAEYVINAVPSSATNWQVLLTIDVFSVKTEATIPTWYSALLLFGASALFVLIATSERAKEDRYSYHWFGLAAIFLYLSIDEGAAIHAIVADMIQQTPSVTGYGWQIVVAPLVLIFALLYLRFLLHLPSRTRNLLILAGVLYIGGALVVDVVSANQGVVDGGVTLASLVIGTVEELCKMLGLVVLIYALLAYIVDQDYVYEFHPPLSRYASDPYEAADSTPLANGTHTPLVDLQNAIRDIPARGLVVVVGALLIGLNLFLLSWATVEASVPAGAGHNPDVSVETIIDQAIGGDVQVTRTIGRFGVDNPKSSEVAGALLSIYHDVMVVNAASMDSSIMLAADALPFDRNSLADTLSARGVTEFIIFDTPAVRALVDESSQ
ncbi:MAG: hypothetical protein IT320_00615 [Anaerolineae bacterium]|nr:hypothetical protein [Anaerolineae bacterium]